MEAGDVVRLLKLLEQEKIGVAVDGGWGTDALLAAKPGPPRGSGQHKDVD